ncbi:hypothetical protein RGCCGE502_16560 [Rhizobium grahamii CCGE 502]|uniref:Uncharacterized protein n=1 Tax=Rhizobium grahamii CCGE 502 TaxID=990285 RepID=S3HVL3_9HYPH|nr:hypothetical protein RGCCGE502_16560 [Rhizobium grahamii CCGE 502]
MFTFAQWAGHFYFQITSISTPQNRQGMPTADVNGWVSTTSIAKLIAFRSPM